jgi:hypothetical protein
LRFTCSRRYFVSLLYWYISTNADEKATWPQHISHMLGLSAATQGVGWALRKALVQALVEEGRSQSEGESEGGHHSSRASGYEDACAAADSAGAPPQTLPLRMRQMKTLLIACQSSKDLRDLVRKFLIEPS